MSQHCALKAQKTNCILGCIKISVASRAREVVLSIYVREISLGVQYPDVESSLQEKHGPLGAHPEVGHKNAPRDGTLSWQEQAQRAGAVQPGEEKAPR